LSVLIARSLAGDWDRVGGGSRQLLFSQAHLTRSHTRQALKSCQKLGVFLLLRLGKVHLIHHARELQSARFLQTEHELIQPFDLIETERRGQSVSEFLLQGPRQRIASIPWPIPHLPKAQIHFVHRGHHRSTLLNVKAECPLNFGGANQLQAIPSDRRFGGCWRLSKTARLGAQACSRTPRQMCGSGCQGTTR